MGLGPMVTLDRWSGRIRRFAVRHIQLFAVRIGIAAVTLLVASWHLPSATPVQVAEIVLLMLSPTLLFEATAYGPRSIRAIRRLVRPRPETIPQPVSPPIEEIAADLRRLLWLHDEIMRSDDRSTRARRLRVLEAQITDRAALAARVLDMPHWAWPVIGGLDKPELRRLLRDLTAEGLVLPPAVGLLAPDTHF